MKRTTLFSLVLAGLLLATVLAYQPLVPTNARAAASPPPAGVPTVPLYRLFAHTTGIHFYTIDVNRKQEAMGSGGWTSEGTAAHILSEQASGTVPLYVLLVKLRFEHESGDAVFGYTTSEQEKNQLLQAGIDFLDCGYVNKGGTKWKLDGNGIAGYIASKQLTGTVPLYRLYHPPVFGPDDSVGEVGGAIQIANRRHFRKCLFNSYDNLYTTSEKEKADAIIKHGYKFVRIEGYVWPTPTTVMPQGDPGKADTVLLNRGCTRPAVGEYKRPTQACYEACLAYQQQGSVKACYPTVNPLIQASIDKMLFSLGCMRFLGRADEFMCKTQQGLDLCETYKKNKTVKNCLVEKK